LGYVTLTRERNGNVTEFQRGYLKETYDFGDLGVDWRIISTCTLQNGTRGSVVG
jgi:hypothetical protein